MTSAPLPLSVLLGEPLARHTAVRTGGRCDGWVVAHDVAGVAEVVADCRAAGWRLQVLGAGTRSVFRDGPVQGIVLRLGQDFAHVALSSTAERVTLEVGAAVPVPAVVRAAATAGARGIEDMACVPGSFGASLLYDDLWDGLVPVVRVLRRGKEVDVGLDEARRKRPVVLGARVVLQADDPAAVLARTRRVWTRQGPVPSGSWYGEPRRAPVRRALRGARLTMVRLREVAIPDAAPELLVNLGEGTAADLALLHRSALERVLRMQGEQLASRIRWLGRTEGEACESDVDGLESSSAD